jgi:hypothetical protein
MRHIPPYVSVIFAVVVMVGIQRCFPREIRAERVIVFPLLLALFGVNSLHGLFPAAAPDYSMAAALMGGAGMLLGWLHAARWQLQFDPATRLVRVPGDPSLLFILLTTFAAHFFLHYAVQSHQPWAATGRFALAAFAAWGLLAGMPLGRSLNVFVRCLRPDSPRRSAPTLE